MPIPLVFQGKFHLPKIRFQLWEGRFMYLLPLFGEQDNSDKCNLQVPGDLVTEKSHCTNGRVPSLWF